MRTLGVIANPAKERAPAVLERLVRQATALGLPLIPDRETARLMGCSSQMTPREVVQQADVVMVLGGDGSMLRAVRELDGRDVPVIGVNLGSLGFMTSVTENDLERALDCLVKEEYSTTRRSMIDCRIVRAGVVCAHYTALNDAVVFCGTRVGTLQMSIDRLEVGDCVCDGLVISTPTGSTGHALSAGGPVLLPSSPSFVVAFICPHTLSIRPLVLADHSLIEVVVRERAVGARLAIDGQVGTNVELGDAIQVRRSENSVRFLHLPGYDYFSVLRQKLHWRGSNV